MKPPVPAKPEIGGATMSRLTDAIDANRRGEAVPPRTQTPKK